MAGLAYSMSLVAEDEEFVIDDPESIRRHRASLAWVEKHGSWNKETDLEALLAAWEPESPEDLEPIHFSMAKKMCAYIPRFGGVEDDAEYRGEVVDVKLNCLRLFGVEFWWVDVAIARNEQDLVIPFFVAERTLSDEWRPRAGDYV